jgi:hypothetical protein
MQSSRAILTCSCLAAAASARAAGPDLTVLSLNECPLFGTVTVPPLGPVNGYFAGHSACNLGNQDAAYINLGSPAFTVNAYRLQDGRLVQVGLGFAKTACCAVAQAGCGTTCNGVSGEFLGAGCSDTTSASFSATQTRLAPRSAINAWTGAVGSFPQASGDAIFRRLQIAQSDLSPVQFPGAQYFIEGVLVAQDDAASGNAGNNASYRRVSVQPNLSILMSGPTATQAPAIQAWRDHGLGTNIPDPDVTIGQVTVPDEGTFWWGCKVRDLGGGQYRYDYALYNLNSDRAAGSLAFTLRACVTTTGESVARPRYHSGEPASYNDPWTIERVAGDHLVFRTPHTHAQNPDSSALRWGTLLSVRFQCNAPPVPGSIRLGLFKPGTTAEVSIDAPVPGPRPCRTDLDNDGNADQNDVLYLISVVAGGENPTGIDPDMNCDGNADQDDVAVLIGVIAGGPCP